MKLITVDQDQDLLFFNREESDIMTKFLNVDHEKINDPSTIKAFGNILLLVQEEVLKQTNYLQNIEKTKEIQRDFYNFVKQLLSK